MPDFFGGPKQLKPDRWVERQEDYIKKKEGSCLLEQLEDGQDDVVDVAET